jgi:hypothetical protein
MTLVVIFTLGYLIGGVSALLVLGLTVAGRNGSYERRSVELVSRDETYSV